MKKFLFFALVVLFLVPTTAFAATFRATQPGATTVGSQETIKNAYLAGNTVNVNGVISQDLVAAGNTVTVSGVVQDNANLAGNSVTVSGNIGKSLRAVGGTVTINSKIGSDLLIAGGTVSLGQSSTVSNDFAVAGGTIDLDGTVGGKAYLTGGQITINGKVDGDVIIKESTKVIIGENAVIGGNLDYSAQKEASIAPGAQIAGTTNFTKIADQSAMSSKLKNTITVFSLVMALAMFLLILILIYAFPKLMHSAVEKSYSTPWENLGIGFIYLVVIPVAIIILLFTIIGIPIGMLGIGLYALTLCLARILVPILVGSLIYKGINKEKTYRISWLTALIGVFVTLVIGLIPFIGPLAIFGIYLLALSQFARGGIALLKSQRN